MPAPRTFSRRTREDAPDTPPWPLLGGRSLRIGVPIAAIAALIVVAVVSAGGGELIGLASRPPALADLVPYDGRSPREPAGDELRVVVALPRPALGELPGSPSIARQRAYVASLRDESASLRSALAARGVGLRDVTTFQRVFNGFAATVDVEDLSDLSGAGVRAQPVRRVFPATSDPVPVATRATATDRAADGPEVALLAGGVEPGAGVRGHDAVDGDADASPEPAPRRAEVSGAALAGALAGAGARVLPVRVASLRPGAGGVEEAGTSDLLLAGLEWVVDPDGDGATDDAVPVALVGVHAPYAGFASSPEARAVRVAAALGTLVVAPAGHEGAGGTVGSPGAAAEALTVGALAAPDAVPRVALRVGEERVESAAALGGAPPGAVLRSAGPVAAEDPEAYLRPGAPRLQGRAVVVRAGANPSAQVAAAAAAGARLVVLADSRDRTLAAPPAGRAGVPVVGVTGEGARAVLDVRAGAPVRVGAVRAPRRPAAPATDAGTPGAGEPQESATPGDGSAAPSPTPRAGNAGGSPAPAETARPTATTPAAGGAGVSPFSSHGPALGGTPKPDLVAAGAARTAMADGRPAVVGGTGVAAALVAAEAARLAAARPEATPAQLAAALRAAAAPVPGPPEARGAGRLAPPEPVAADAPLPEAEPVVMSPAPGGPVPLGPLRLTREDGRATGVRFTVGAFDRGDPLGTATTIRAAGSLRLSLVTADGTTVRRLTPPGGARDLLPAEYAYTLADDAIGDLPSEPLRFRAVARGPLGGPPARGRSPSFTP